MEIMENISFFKNNAVIDHENQLLNRGLFSTVYFMKLKLVSYEEKKARSSFCVFMLYVCENHKSVVISFVPEFNSILEKNRGDMKRFHCGNVSEKSKMESW